MPEGRAVNGNEHLLDRVVQALRYHGCRVTPNRKGGVDATCPVHHGKRKNLSVNVGRDGDRVVLHCFRGCHERDVLAALGLKMSNLYCELPDRDRIASRSIVALYDYVDLNGRLMAQKVRMSNKRFWWRSPGAKGGWLKGLKGAIVGLYHLPELIDTATIYLVEGEKAADQLWSLGVPATCGPWGAGSWSAQLTAGLQVVGCRDAVIFPDHDQKGSEHAELVAASLFAVDITVKVVLPVGTAAHENAVDWLGTHTVDELLTIVSAAPLWAPGAKERDQQARKLMFTAARVRKFRAKPSNVVSVTELDPAVTEPDPNVVSVTPVACNAVTHDYVFQVRSRESTEKDLPPVVLPSVPAHALQVHGQDRLPVVPSSSVDAPGFQKYLAHLKADRNLPVDAEPNPGTLNRRRRL
jgi:hypothetical protein